LIRRYVENVVVAERAMIDRVFHVLRWTKREVDAMLAALVTEGELVKVTGQDEGSRFVVV
jgi:hypothetical protein